MATAYILIISESGMEQKVAEELALLDCVSSTDILYGEYDIIAKAKVGDASILTDFILNKIRPIEGVKRTSTLIVARD